MNDLEGHVPLSSSDHDWYVARVEHGREALAQAHLISVGFTDTFVPLRLADAKTPTNPLKSSRNASFSLRHDDAPRTYPLWRGYVFARTDLFTSLIWHLACPAEGLRYHGLVKGFLGGWPAEAVPSSCIEDMRARCDARGVVVEYEELKVLFLPGALVRILDDLYQGQVFQVIFDTGVGVNLRSVQGAGYSVYMPDRRKVEPIPNEALRKGAPIGKPVSEARTKRTRRGFRKVRSYVAA